MSLRTVAAETPGGGVRRAPWTRPARRSGRSPGRWRAARRADVPRSSTSPPSTRGSALLNAWLALPVPECQYPPSLRRSARRPARRVAHRRRYARCLPSPAWTGTAADVLTATGVVAAGRRPAQVARRAGNSWSRTPRPAGAAPWCGSRRPAVCRWCTSRTGAGGTRGLPARPRVPRRRAPVDAHPPRRRRPRRWPRPGGAASADRERVARRARPARHGWRRARGSSSRAGTTPSWSRRSGATTCASRASSSRCWTASTTCPRRSPTSGPARAAGWASSSTTSCRAPRSAGIVDAVRALPGCRARQGPGPPLRRRVAVGAARAARTGRVAGRPARPGRGSTASARRLGWPHDSQADIALAWKRILGTVR